MPPVLDHPFSIFYLRSSLPSLARPTALSHNHAMPRSRPDVRIGISGWTYTPWRGTFYPDGLAHRLELTYAATRLNSIEINGSFYSLQRPSSYRAWYDATPANFVFAVKGG